MNSVLLKERLKTYRKEFGKLGIESEFVCDEGTDLRFYKDGGYFSVEDEKDNELKIFGSNKVKVTLRLGTLKKVIETEKGLDFFCHRTEDGLASILNSSSEKQRKSQMNG